MAPHSWSGNRCRRICTRAAAGEVGVEVAAEPGAISTVRAKTRGLAVVHDRPVPCGVSCSTTARCLAQPPRRAPRIDDRADGHPLDLRAVLDGAAAAARSTWASAGRDGARPRPEGRKGQPALAC
jgi:hypothetical protein